MRREQPGGALVGGGCLPGRAGDGGCVGVPLAGRTSLKAVFGDSRLPERFWNKVSQATNGCWIWTGYIMPNGYGQVRLDGKARLVHRAAYAALVAEPAAGLDLDHLCRARACCNPADLEEVSRIENVMRGALGRLHTHCYKGHELTDDNLYRQGPEKRHRVCRICAIRRGEEYRARVALRCG